MYSTISRTFKITTVQLQRLGSQTKTNLRDFRIHFHIIPLLNRHNKRYHYEANSSQQLMESAGNANNSHNFEILNSDAILNVIISRPSIHLSPAFFFGRALEERVSNGAHLQKTSATDVNTSVSTFRPFMLKQYLWPLASSMGAFHRQQHHQPRSSPSSSSLSPWSSTRADNLHLISIAIERRLDAREGIATLLVRFDCTEV